LHRLGSKGGDDGGSRDPPFYEACWDEYGWITSHEAMVYEACWVYGLGMRMSRSFTENSKSWPSISSHKRVVILRCLIAPLWLYVTLEGNIEMVDGLFIGQCGRTVVSFAQWKCAELVVLDNYSLAIVFVLRVLEYNAWYFARKQVHWKYITKPCCKLLQLLVWRKVAWTMLEYVLWLVGF
jgi:hypothetical protein